MPQIFKLGSYWVYWTNESKALELIHGHVSEDGSFENSTKIWITQSGNSLLCHNNSRIPERILRNIMRMIETRSSEVIEKLKGYFGEISYCC